MKKNRRDLGSRRGNRQAEHGNSSIASLRKEVLLIKNTLIETKYYDELNNFTPSQTGQAFCLNNFAQGDTVMTRNGAKTFVEKIALRFYAQTNANLVGPVNLRVMIVEDLSPSGQAVNLGIGGVATFLGPTGVLDNTTITGAPEIMPHAFEMKHRYRVIYDHEITLNPHSASSTTPATGVVAAVINKTKFFRKDISVKAQSVYADGTANIASLLKGSLVALCFSNQNANLPFVVMGTRVFFKDA